MSVIGLNSNTGRAIDGVDHLRQSVRDILITPLGSRVMRRDYGSGLFELIDQNVTPLYWALIYAATVDALRKWEPRLRITRVQGQVIPAELELGKVSLDLYAQYIPNGQEIRLDGVVL